MTPPAGKRKRANFLLLYEIGGTYIIIMFIDDLPILVFFLNTNITRFVMDY